MDAAAIILLLLLFPVELLLRLPRRDKDGGTIRAKDAVESAAAAAATAAKDADIDDDDADDGTAM